MTAYLNGIEAQNTNIFINSNISDQNNELNLINFEKTITKF